MDLNIIQEFLVLAEKLNFSETAKQFYIAQSVLSRHIAQMEKELDCPLFYRNHQSVELTEYGKMFLSHARQIVDEYNKSVEQIEERKRKLKSTLHIAYIFDVVGNRMGDLLHRFMEKYPEVELRYNMIDQVISTVKYIEQYPEADVVINYLCEPVPKEKYQIMNWFREPICLIVRKDHPLADKVSVTFQELQKERLVECSAFQHSFYRQQLRDALDAAGSGYIHACDAKSFKSALVMVESGVGVTIAPWNDGRYNLSNLRSVPIEDDFNYLEVGAIWRTNNLNPNIQKFMKIMQE